MRALYQDPKMPECGAVCLAMLANITLGQARAHFYNECKPHRLGRGDIVSALEKFGKRALTVKPITISNRNRLINVRHDALVYARAISKNDEGEYKESHHWVVWDGKVNAVRDPLGFTEQLKLTSYTEIV